jgi:CRP-like cAMP-binding protein
MLAALPDLGDYATISALPSFDASAILYAESARHIEQVKIAEALKVHPVFQGADDEELLALAERSRLAHYPADAIIVARGELPREMPILLDGRVYHYTQARDGWENPLRLLKGGDILSYSVLFEGQRTSDLIVNNRDEATVIWLPKAELLDFLAAHPKGMIEIARRLHSDKRVYARLWTNAE